MKPAVVAGVLAALVAGILAVSTGDQTGPAPFVVDGVISGAVYGLVAIGLVLVYKGARVFNFAQGEFGTIAAYVAYVAINNFDQSYLVALPAALLVVLALGLVMERVIVRPLMNQPRVTLLVATIAVTLLLIGLEILIFRIEPLFLEPVVSLTGEGGGVSGIKLFDFIVDPMRIAMMGVLAVLAGALAYFFSRTDLGLAVLATSQDSFATRVVGIPVQRVSRFIWGAAAMLGAIAGILYVPPIAGQLVPAVMTSNVLIPAFTAAVIGGMTSLPGAFLGGVVVGLVQKLSSWAATTYYLGEVPIQQTVPGAEQIAVFAALLLILLIRPQGLLGKEA
ncbi:MAG: branched-chain amino acid ABC transporter permease [Actinomycetota bacterium]|nr:branched-chain amino acid ABC transporter permease [Actinomycetota bacterium]